jgi:hypothetical protein
VIMEIAKMYYAWWSFKEIEKYICSYAM